ncbi:MAG: transcriptional regulator [Cyclobacteriaceae bacterium]|nr:transcriptional regulator [Cyclobacteriaceae bacterium HetDA_MAG_MS6]
MLFRSIFFVFLSILAGELIGSQKIDSLLKVLDQYPSDDMGKVDLLNTIGYEYWIVNPVQSVIYGQRAKGLAESINSIGGQAFACRVIGVAYWAKGNYDDALKYLLKSLDKYSQEGDQLGQANVTMNIGLVYAATSNFSKAKEMYMEALRWFVSMDERSRIGTTYTKIGTAYINLNQLDSAAYYFDRALAIHQRMDFIYGQSEVYNRIGLLRSKQRDWGKAITMFNRSIELGVQVNDLEGLAKNYENLADVHIQLGRLNKAEELLLLGVEIATAIGSNKWLKELFDDLRRIYQIRGNRRKSLYYFEQYVSLSDSLYNEQIMNNMVALETQIATAEKEKRLAEQSREIQLLEARSRFDRLLTLSVIVVLLMIVLVGYLVINRLRLLNRRKAEKAEEESLRFERELEFKNKELTSYALNFVQKNQLFAELDAEINHSKKIAEPVLLNRLNNLTKIIDRHLQVDKDWEDFNLRFQNLHQQFFDNLLDKNGSLTNYELRLSALIKLNFSMKEIGNILGISAESVKTARYRLKKKLGLSQEENLNDFLNELAR